MNGKGGIKIGGRRTECIRFADYLALSAETVQKIRQVTEDLSKGCEEYGMRKPKA